MQKTLVIVLALALMVTAGCTTGKRKKRGSGRSGGGVAAQPVSGGKASSAAAGGSLAERVKAALVPPDGLASIGGPADKDGEDKSDNYNLGRVCDAKLPTDSVGENIGMVRFWTGTRIQATQLVSGNADVTAADAIDAVKTAYGSCQDYSYEGEKHVLAGPLAIPAPAGVEVAYAWTEKVTEGTKKSAVCELFLGKGNLISWMTMEGTTVETATESCRKVAPVAAKYLAAA